MNAKVLFSIAVLLVAALACSSVSIDRNTVVGSGKVVSETRSVDDFRSVELSGSGDVDVKPGTANSVVVEADDNIVPLIETYVSTGRLIIRTKRNVNISTSRGIKVHVVAKAFESVALSGSGNMKVEGASGPQLTVTLPGSGDISVAGSVESVAISLLGSGNIYCENLKANSGTVTIFGSGNVNVYAAKSLDASILGSGNIQYAGNPAQVTKKIAGSGSITPQAGE